MLIVVILYEFHTSHFAVYYTYMVMTHYAMCKECCWLMTLIRVPAGGLEGREPNPELNHVSSYVSSTTKCI